MYYYPVYLPLALTKEFHFAYPQRIVEGARVLVSFNSRDMIGICGAGVAQAPAPDIDFKLILEVLDTAPVMAGQLIALAQRMAGYYRCSVGAACFAMLPAWLIPDVNTEVKWLAKEYPEQYTALARELADGEPHRIADLRKKLPGQPVLRWVEQASNAGWLEIERKLSPKDKPKIVNYIRRLDFPDEFSAFAPRQREALQLIQASGREELPLADLSELVSYSVIKTLTKKGVLEIVPRKVERAFFQYESSSAPKSILLTTEQQQAIEEILPGLGSFSARLLFGITGSGKTEVYIAIIRACLAQGRGVIFLIPEIALTPQMVERFQSEFGSVLAISHSQLSDRQRLQQWQKISRGECQIVIGARSAVFAPMPRPGLIIVDEEHEQTYKQDSNPRYNGRDMAVLRASLEGALVLLGSATPSLESWHNQQLGKYDRHNLLQRPLDIKLPEVRIVDLCGEQELQLLSNELIAAVNLRLERHEQVILFQNRRGFSSYLQCLKCGELVKCANCEISMYYHRDREEMHCHYCGHSFPSPRKCPHCGSYSFSYGSPGTQKVEQLLQICFPTAKVLRLDSDSARRVDSYKTMYRRMKDKDVDILLGTQMISKGLDFPNVTLVGIVNADISLNLPDFRSAERTFQLCTQVAGRAGRADKAGEVLIQTCNPEHYAILHASKQDYTGFAEEELEFRRRLNYPPYYRLARILYQSTDASLLQQEMNFLAERVLEISSGFPDPQLFILGPTPAPFPKMNRFFRQHIIIKGLSAAILGSAITRITQSYEAPTAIRVQVDIDPLSLM